MEIKIIDYEDKYAKYFAQINFQWLDAYFYIENYDREVLTKPEKYIIEPGGHILFAKVENKIVGTVALIVREEGTYELSKMGVLKGYRGFKIGQKLMDAALSYCKKAGKTRVILDSSTKLTPALSLYKKLGFIEIPVDPNTPYERCDIRMEMWL
ncbi:MAG: GNAT family N-acetyltransferase [Flavobacteriales bacterium]|nr:GNAT family N-acetyltransferase [Flavobacteriales bacterium]